MLRISDFTTLVELEYMNVLVNGACGTIDFVSKEFSNILRSPELMKNGDWREDIVSLEKRGHLTELSSHEELELFRKLSLAVNSFEKVLDTRQAYTMMLMSYFCNFDCHYCYQRTFRKSVEKPYFTKEKMENFLEKRVPQLFPNVPPEKQVFVLYGGEPFVSRNKPAIKALIDYSKRTGAVINAISNGYNIIDFLEFFGQGRGFVENVQITFDSSQEIHDKTRVLQSGGATFAKILDNLRPVAETGTRLNIRVHLHQNGQDELDKFRELLQKTGVLEFSNVRVTVSPIKDDFKEHDLKADQQSKTHIKSIGNDVFSDYTKLKGKLTLLSKLNQGKGILNTIYCMRSKVNSYVVDPLDDVYTCYEEAGRKEFRAGYFEGDRFLMLPYMEQALNRSIGSIVRKKACAVSPFCSAGCAATARTQYGSSENTGCDCDFGNKIFQDAVKDTFSGEQTEFISMNKAHLKRNMMNDESRNLQALIEMPLVPSFQYSVSQQQVQSIR